jgi:hypothetical protein
MAEEKKNDVWSIVSESRMLYRVCFDRPVTKVQAMNLFNASEFEDIVDEETLSMVAISVDD